MSEIVVTPQIVTLFSNASGDRNPLHVSPKYARATAFGQPIAHGILGVIACLGSSSRQDALPRTIKVDFRGPIFPNEQYSLQLTDRASSMAAVIKDGDHELLSLGVDCEPGVQAPATKMPAEVEPVEVQTVETSVLVSGAEWSGEWAGGQDAFEALCARFACPATSTTAALLACSYIVGMVVPGEPALFSRLHLTFSPENCGIPVTGFSYRARIRSYQIALGFLVVDLTLLVGGAVFAVGEIRAFVRQQSDDASPWEEDTGAKHDLRGKTCVVIGASRGLGAVLLEGLVRSGATAIGTYRESHEQAEKLQARLIDFPGKSQMRKVDATSLEDCEGFADSIGATHGQIDSLICNACPPIRPLGLQVAHVSRIEEHIANSVKLVLNPLASLGPLMAESACAVFMSSSVVNKPVAEWPHYVAAKHAIEGLAFAFVQANSEYKGLIVRPPRIQTDLTNTPLGKRGALPPKCVASAIVDWISHSHSLPCGATYWLEDFSA